MNIGENLKYLRERNEMTQDEFGKTINTNRKTISGWETGADLIPINKIIEICNKYHINILFLLGIINNYEETSITYYINAHKIALTIFNLRKKLNINQRNMSEILEISQSTLSKYESGKTIPKVSFFVTINKKLKIDITCFFK